MQEKDRHLNDSQEHSALSAVWQELLGQLDSAPIASSDAIIPTIESDPWSELLHDKGVEVVDLQTVHLHISEQEVEQVLQLMQEQNTREQQ